MLAGTAAVMGACLSLQVWRASLEVPFDATGDGAFYLMLTRGLERTGHYLTNPGLGYPAGQELYDLPHGADNLNLLLLRVAALVGEPGLALNLFYLAGFFLVGACMHVVLRRVGARPAVAGVMSVLFALAPFHLLRGTVHVLLSAYYCVPIAMALALLLLSDDPPLARWRRWRPVVSARDAGVAVACAVLASTGAYYAFFSLLLLVLAGAVAGVARRSWGPVRSAALQVSIVAAVFVANISPSIAYWLREGSNPRITPRFPVETEVYGLRISQLVLPRPDHRVDELARISADSLGGPIGGESGQNLGLVAGAGLLILLGVAGWRVVARAPGSEWWTTGRGRSVLDAAFLTLGCLLTAAAGGFSYLLSAAGATEIRAWNRMSIVIAALACLAVALVVSELLDRLERAGRAAWGVVALVVIFVLGFLDQTSPADGRGREADAIAWRSQHDFFRAVAETLPEGSAVFQLPVMEFPEVPPTLGTGPYDHALAFVHAPSLRWSFGAMKGRVPDPVPAFDYLPGEQMAEALGDQGFQAVVVDRAGYIDHGAGVEARLATVAGPPATVSADDRYCLFVID
jgi:phosphoglycerol transferase